MTIATTVTLDRLRPTWDVATAVDEKMGFGVALLLDATVIRPIILPTAMRLLGGRTWYLPARLQRLPRLQIEGRG